MPGSLASEGENEHSEQENILRTLRYVEQPTISVQSLRQTLLIR
jgi:hypothetical protein